MFGYFKRLSARPTGGENSSGVGLAIAKQIVELHGGLITLDTEYGKGSTFTVELPSVTENAQALHSKTINQTEEQVMEGIWRDIATTIIALQPDKRAEFLEAIMGNNLPTLARLAEHFATHDESIGMTMVALQAFAEGNNTGALDSIRAALNDAASATTAS